MTVQAICAQFPVSRFAIMNHLNVLEACGIVSSEKRSIYRHFSLNRDVIDEVWRRWRSRLD